jgi:hypothetical protein
MIKSVLETKGRVLIVFGLTMTLLACGGGTGDAVPTKLSNSGGTIPSTGPTALPSLKPTPVANPSAIPTATATPSPAATATPKPTSIPTATPTSSVTPTPTPTVPPGTSTDVWPPAMPATLPTDECAPALIGAHGTFNVGPGQTYTELTQVPWLSLQAGDVVNIYYRPTPYRTKFSLHTKATAAQPLVINGVTDAQCHRPEITGDGAVTASDAAAAGFWAPSEQALGLIQIYRAPTDNNETHLPSYITIQNLKLTGTHYTKTFTGNNGQRMSYDRFASAIYGLRVAHLTVENCEITSNGMGIFTNSRGYNPIDFSSYTIIRRNKIYLNGTGGSTEHNLYIQSYRSLYEGNFLGAVQGGTDPKTGAIVLDGQGSTIKDRSSGTVIRYNQIVAGARAIDLVESEDGENLRGDTLYDYAWVYGNLIINDSSQVSLSARLIHWGFDNNFARSRKGTLYFYHNTLINRSLQSEAYYTTIFHMNPEIPSTAVIEARSNLFANYGDTEYQLITEAGRLNLRGTNLLPTGWVRGQPSVTGTIDTVGATLLTASDAALAGDYRPLAISPAVNKAGSVLGSFPAGVQNVNLQVTQQPRAPTGWVARPVVGAADLGAFELP